MFELIMQYLIALRNVVRYIWYILYMHLTPSMSHPIACMEKRVVLVVKELLIMYFECLHGVIIERCA